ncbi:MAG TPA: DUF938 domain-containing protein [Synechococcales cyanobacterium M55_K2018_004]|nr:DUF938 domain-containing protein [Synechococcales cyanobacterium M55_K2018_004]
MDDRQHAPATLRNRQPILEVLQEVLPPTGSVLEISSGTGEHAIFLAPRLRPRQWIASDVSPEARASIDAWRRECPSENLWGAIALDTRDPVWPVERSEFAAQVPELDLRKYPIRAIVNINMIHIAPWDAALGLFAGAGRILPEGGILFLYGPFKRAGQHTAPSNEAFDQSLRSQDPAWGVRNLEDVIEAAQERGLFWMKTVEMPANNLSVVFRRRSQ